MNDPTRVLTATGFAMDPYISIKVRFPQEDQPLVEPLSAFLLAFIQALLKTGYYQASHPGSTAAKLGLYQQWLRLGLKEKEISVVTRETEDDIVIYGVLSDVVSLKRLFLPSVAELFIPKLRQYFNWRQLMSFTLKSGITREEFEGFVDLLSDLPSAPTSPQAVSETAKKLVEMKIVHVSVVYTDDAPLVERPMHWMAKIALTRLGKDLRMVPLYKHLTPDQMSAMKTQIFREIMRPLSNCAVLKDVLVHCDILRIPSKGETLEQIEEALYKGLNRDQMLGLLLESARALEAETLPHARSGSASIVYTRLVGVIQKALQNMPEGTSGRITEELLEMLLEKRVVVLDELPPIWVDAVLVKRKTEDYLKHKQRYWDMLEVGWPKEAQSFMAVLSVLLARDDFHHFFELLDRFHGAFSKTFGADAEFFKASGMAPLGDMIIKKLQARRFEKRKEMLFAVEPFAGIVAPCLFPLCAHEDLWLRRNICRVLATVGATVTPALIAFAQEHKPWTVIRNVVMILGDIGAAGDAVFHFLKRCQHHPHIRVQEEVINSYGKIKGPDAENLLLQTLENSDCTMLSRVVLALAHRNTVNERYCAYLREALRRKQKNEIEVETSIQVACCLALEALIPLHPDLLELFEPILCASVMPQKSLFRWMAKDQEKDDDVKEAIFHLLGEIGTGASLPVTNACLKSEKAEWKDRIERALQKIEQRHPTPTPT